MIKANKTLLILTPGFPQNEMDTTCLPDRQIFIKALKKNDPDLTIIVLAFQYPFISKTYNWHGIKVISFNGRNKGNLSRLWVWFKVWRTLNKIKKENKIIGLLNFWLGECALVGKYFAKKNNIKHYTWILGQDARKGNKYFAFVKPKAANLIALSDFITAEFYKNYGVKPQHTIPVGIDVGMFTDLLLERNIDIMGAGSLIPLKQYDIFIDVIKELIPYFPNIKAVICGTGTEKEKLSAQIKKNSLQNNISLLGELPHQDVINLMQRTKIFLHTSMYEGFGSVCAEALYAGAHVVSLIKPMNILFKHQHIVNNKREMTEKIIEILKNTNSQHDRVLMYSSEDIAQQMMKLFTG